MLKIGLMGFGFMGLTHYQAYSQLKDAEVVAIYDLEPEKVKKGDVSAGNIDSGADKLDLSGISITDNPNELLQNDEIDIIDVCLPTFLHSEYTVKSLKAGKNVFCEKPMALNTEECDRMIAARNETGKLLMIGQCIRFWPEYSYIREAIKANKYGRVLSAFFRRLSPTPDWSCQNWILDSEKSGGALLDLHIHDIDYILHTFGDVLEVEATGVRNAVNPQSGVGYVVCRYKTESPAVIVAEGGWHFHAQFPFNMSFHIRCEEATIVFDAGQDNTLAVYNEDGEAEYPRLPGTTGWDEELKYFLNCVKDNVNVDVSPPEESRKAVEVALLEIENIKNSNF